MRIRTDTPYKAYMNLGQLMLVPGTIDGMNLPARMWKVMLLAMKKAKKATWSPSYKR